MSAADAGRAGAQPKDRSACESLVVHEISFSVAGYPPAKDEAKSMLAAGHMYADRVLALLRAAAAAGPHLGTRCSCSRTSALPSTELSVASAAPPPTPPTTSGASHDVLEDKARRGAFEHLADLSIVALYSNDRQIEELHYYYRRGEPTRCQVRIWVVDGIA